MRKAKSLWIVAALSAVAAFAMPTAGAAAPKQKISYEEAFKRCKAYIDKEKGGMAHSTTNELNRTRRGAACMQKFGYKL